MSKLYTEEQLKKFFEEHYFITEGDLKNFIPIELPTADEILYESQGVFVNRIDMYEEGFIDGAEWVVNKIKGGGDAREQK